MTNKEIYRPRTSWVYFGIVAAIELSVIISFAVANRSHDVLLTLINCAAADLLFYIFVVKPKVVYSAEKLQIVNPLQTINIGWLRAEEFDTRFSFKVETDKGTFGAWAATAPGRYRTRSMHESDYRGTTLGNRKVISPSDNPKSESGIALVLAIRGKSDAVAAGTASNELTMSFDWIALTICLVSAATLIFNFLH